MGSGALGWVWPITNIIIIHLIYIILYDKTFIKIIKTLFIFLFRILLILVQIIKLLQNLKIKMKRKSEYDIDESLK